MTFSNQTSTHPIYQDRFFIFVVVGFVVLLLAGVGLFLFTTTKKTSNADNSIPRFYVKKEVTPTSTPSPTPVLYQNPFSQPTPTETFQNPFSANQSTGTSNNGYQNPFSNLNK